ncbi:hypothetical protein [Larsenimonas rhizosphaerae]|uniref:DUF2232 domain-containing protein n=1 Tax=Larsenimonas rhizosphaerae TaxID=2944682 RepID=A0AA41ZE21_9GAMM|nr:hypothetical protein [Larsenimonas rhizosphaerae]MCM2130154.1 hypothetical protein [Larsenimonas rhizosphaerae]MCX2522841.1 hypothetical protein [Larsenimonas rhizosphaerae]
MVSFARWVMRGPLNATLVAFAAGLMPWLFWLGAAICALVTLRRGLVAALPVLIGAALPLGWWWTQGDAVPLSTLLLTTLMAVILRSRSAWGDTLISASVVTGVLIKLGVFVPPNAAAIMTELRHNSAELGNMLDHYARQGVSVEQLSGMVMGSVIGMVVMLASIACLALARGWQAGLYNPGGLREEFHGFRLSPAQLGLLLAVSVVGFLIGFPALVLVTWIPLLIAGIALMHGIIGLKGMSGLWLVGFYALLLTAWPAIVIVILLALADSVLNIRSRLARSQH